LYTLTRKEKRTDELVRLHVLPAIASVQTQRPKGRKYAQNTSACRFRVGLRFLSQRYSSLTDIMPDPKYNHSLFYVILETFFSV